MQATLLASSTFGAVRRRQLHACVPVEGKEGLLECREVLFDFGLALVEMGCRLGVWLGLGFGLGSSTIDPPPPFAYFVVALIVYSSHATRIETWHIARNQQ